MKFDVAIFGKEIFPDENGQLKPFAQVESVSFLVALAMLIGFAKKKHKNFSIIIQTSDHETSKDENDVQP